MSNAIRFQFSKGPEVMFLSHLDVLRAMERALRRAKLPMAFTEGFSPRPIMSFSFALPVGVLSEAEYADFRFAEEMDPADFMERFTYHLPSGFQVIAAEQLAEGSPSLMNEINAALWKVALPHTSRKEIEERLRGLEARDSFVVERQTKKGNRSVDLLPLLFGVSKIEESGNGVDVHCLAGVGNEGNLRVEELGLLLGFSPAEAVITRIGQFKKAGSQYWTPLGNRGFTWTER